MATAPLPGTVLRVPLFILPAFARRGELLDFVKCRLHEAGFTIVREEYRLVNAELAERLCVRLDHVPDYVKIATGHPPHGGAEEKQGLTGEPSFPAAQGRRASALPPSKMVGMAYIFLLAHRDCHVKLLDFIASLEARSFDMSEDELMDLSLHEAYAELLRFAAKSPQVKENSMDGDSGKNVKENEEEEEGLPQALWVNTTGAGARQAVRLLFPRLLMEEVPEGGGMPREYVHEQLKRALLPALADLVREKPAEPIRWLAERLLETDTQTPPMITAEFSH